MSTTDNRYNTLARVAQHLEFLGFPTLVEFQRANGLVADGIFGRKSFAALRDALRRRFCELMGVAKYQKHTLPADPWRNAFDVFRLRTDAAYFYRGLLDEAHEAGALVTSAGSDRSLYANVSAGRSSRSMHYPAIAFDLATNSGMGDPDKDAYVIERDGEHWRVWARCSPERAAEGKLPPKRTIKNPITYRLRRVGTMQPVEDHFLDFTALAAKYNFTRIQPHQSFLYGGNQMGAEWWHFQCEWVLVPGFSTFFDELETLFRRTEIEASPVRNSDAAFGGAWK